jgi:hypothetical protein
MRPLSPTQYRFAALAFFAFAAAVVAIGWVPGWYTMEGSERLLFGLFGMSTLDDITHGVTAIVFLFAAFRTVPMMRLTFITFGSYYALDAVFYLLNGFVNTLPWMSDIALNLPHVVISTIMLVLGYRLAPIAR